MVSSGRGVAYIHVCTCIGGYIDSGGKCFLRHVPTHMYLMVTDDFKVHEHV